MLIPRIADMPIPKRMRTLAKDHRGYPVPYIVLIDQTGKPQFTINDDEKVKRCDRRKLCSICGKPHDRDGFWFVGGSRCFLHPQGAFLDPPLHLECAEYALRVCPFLAARRYTKRIDDAKLAPGATPEGMTLLREEFMMPRLPERFGLGRTLGYRRLSRRGDLPVYVVEGWRYVEFWRNGEPVNAPDTADPPADREMST